MVTKKTFRKALVFASYNEIENLGLILGELDQVAPRDLLIVIADDSGPDNREELERVCLFSAPRLAESIVFDYSTEKAGRGAAIRRSFSRIVTDYPGVTEFVEADSDGSHRPADILRVLNHDFKSDMLIGSRYVEGSLITGWPLSRRALSRILNSSIPWLLSVKAKDLTNGLRRYSTRGVENILKNAPRNAGFIYLSEVAFNISQEGLVIEEIPIHFENRIHGESSVGRKELTDSLTGLLGLITFRFSRRGK